MARKSRKNGKAAPVLSDPKASTDPTPFAAAQGDASRAKRLPASTAASGGKPARRSKRKKAGRSDAPPRPINRELSWLAFDERVLDEARNPAHPLLERVKFLGISAANLEEFFMVRVAGLFRMARADKPATTWDGRRPDDLLGEIQRRVQSLEAEQNRILQHELLPALALEGIELLTPDRLDSHQRAEASERFEHVFLPVLTPMGVDPARPFPALRDQVLHLGIRLKKGEDFFSAFVPIPQTLGRFIELAPRQGRRQILPTEDLASMFLPQLFNGYEILGAWPFQILRDSDFDYEENETEEEQDLLERVRREILHKHQARVVRIHFRSSIDPELLSILRSELELEPLHLHPTASGRLWLSGFLQLAKIPGAPPTLVDPAFPELPLPLGDRPGELFDRIAAHDVLIHHPYDSFATVLRFLREAARDPQVLAIKQTLYRVSPDSAVVAALCQAAEAGKHVSVLVELKARFDERRNIEWAQRLEDAGVHVVHGLLGLKTHCKLLLVIRREESGIRRYLHLGTGNYNEHTSRIYTDFSLLTSDDDIVRDAGNLLNIITGFSDPPDWHALAVAPTGLRPRILQLIEREREHALAGGRGLVLAKMNALVDPTLIDAILAASADGVEFRLLVRGICCLTPNGRKGAGGIQVRSVIDRFLEHSRMAIFHNDGRPEHFIGSADWMTRNFDRRIEVLCPVRDFACRQRLESIFKTYWRGGINVRHLQPDGSYQTPPQSAKKAGRPQIELFDEARLHHEHLERLWHPETHPSFDAHQGRAIRLR